METKTLLLAASGAPHAIIDWQTAVCHVYEGTADVLEEYDEVVSSPSTSYFVPAVMRLRRHVPYVKKGVKFSRVNVFTRDDFRCQYCNKQKLAKDLNYDHVIPRVQGGQTVWENIVTSCYDCNSKKRGRTPEQAGMKLVRHPAKPHALPLHAVILDPSKIPPIWTAYLEGYIDTYRKRFGGTTPSKAVTAA